MRRLNIIPALDLRGGRCVQLVGGDFEAEKVSITDVLGVVRRFETEGATRLHVVDLDAAKGSGDNIPLISRILQSTHLPVEVGGGVRSIERAVELIRLGASYVIVGTAAVSDASFLPALAEQIGKERIIVALDYRDGKVVTHGWDAKSAWDPLALAKVLQKHCGQFMFTCVDVEGKMQGIDAAYLGLLRKELAMPLIASGGVATLADIKLLAELGIDGVVVGMALYTGAIRLGDAQRVANS